MIEHMDTLIGSDPRTSTRRAASSVMITVGTVSAASSADVSVVEAALGQRLAAPDACRPLVTHVKMRA